MSPSFPPGITAAPNPIRKPPIVVFATSATVTLGGRHRLRRWAAATTAIVDVTVNAATSFSRLIASGRLR